MQRTAARHTQLKTRRHTLNTKQAQVSKCEGISYSPELNNLLSQVLISICGVGRLTSRPENPFSKQIQSQDCKLHLSLANTSTVVPTTTWLSVFLVTKLWGLGFETVTSDNA